MKCSDGVTKAKLCPFSFGFAMGFVKGLFMLAIAWSAWLLGYGGHMVDHMASFYNGYGSSLVGGVYGFVWGFVCGFIFGFIFGWVYNRCLSYCCRKSDE